MARKRNSKSQENHKPKKKKTLSEEDKRRARARNRDRMRAKRNEIKSDQERYEIQKAKERTRYHQRVAAGKIKQITELTSREQRRKRKLWKDYARKSRKEKLEREKTVQQTIDFTPPNSPFLDQASIDSPSTSSHGQENQSQSHQRDSGKKRARKNKRETEKKIRQLMDEKETLNKKIKELKSGKERYKKRYLRLKRDKEKDINRTPRKSVKDLMRRENVKSKNIQRELLFGEVLKTQVEENFVSRKSQRERIYFLRCVTGKIVKKYRMMKPLISLTSRRTTLTANIQAREKQKQVIKLALTQKVHQFLQKDENSRLCAGKKECITKKKVKMQRRYLCNSLLELHKKFVASGECKISYATFCKLRPFWIMPPPKKRETCLCIQHENMQLLVTKLKHVNIIEESTPNDIMRNLCCTSDLASTGILAEQDNQDNIHEVASKYNTLKSTCLQRLCTECNGKQIKYNLEASENNDDIFCEKWVIKKQNIIIKGVEKTI